MCIRDRLWFIKLYDDGYSYSTIASIRGVVKPAFQMAYTCLLYTSYREVCWSTIDRANDVCDTLICTYGASLDGALIYLETFEMCIRDRSMYGIGAAANRSSPLSFRL